MNKPEQKTSMHDDAASIAKHLSHIDSFIKEVFTQETYFMIEQICKIFELHVKSAAAALVGNSLAEAKANTDKLDDALASAKDLLKIIKANTELKNISAMKQQH